MVFLGEASGYVRLKNSTPQGGVISSTLFSVLFNILAKLPYPDGTQHIGYADDIVLETKGKDFTAKMQASLNLLTVQYEEIGFTVSQTKTKAMDKTRSITLSKLQIQGRDIEYVATHKYLIVIAARNNTSNLTAPSKTDDLVLLLKGIRATSNVILRN